MLRVAFVDQRGSEAGGAERSLALLLDHLPLDVLPTVVLFEDGRYAQSLRARGYRVEIVPIPPALAQSTRERPTLRAAVRLPAAAFHLARLFQCWGVDVVHTNTVKAHLVAASAARIAGLPCVVHLRDILEGSSRTALRMIAAGCSQERIAISRAVARAYALPDTVVIENPLDVNSYGALPDRTEARRDLGIGGDEPVVAIVGRINRWKGHDRFLRAAARVCARASVQFAIVGAPVFRDADFLEELRALADALGLRSRVHFIGWLDDPRAAYAAIDVLCNCSKREPFGRTIIEAAAAGIPSVCFDDGGAAEAVIHGVTGLVVPAEDEAALAAAILTYVFDPDQRAAAGAAARAATLRFDARRHADKVVGVLRRAAA